MEAGCKVVVDKTDDDYNNEPQRRELLKFLTVALF
jgi:hypothetical protein